MQDDQNELAKEIDRDSITANNDTVTQYGTTIIESTDDVISIIGYSFFETTDRGTSEILFYLSLIHI